MGKRRHGAKWQNPQTKTTKNRSGEFSPYWNWLADHESRVASPLANIDTLAEDAPIERDTINRRVMRDVLTTIRLSTQERRVLRLLGREGLTQEAAAEALGISRRAVRVTFKRAQKKCIEAYEIRMAQEGDL